MRQGRARTPGGGPASAGASVTPDDLAPFDLARVRGGRWELSRCPVVRSGRKSERRERRERRGRPERDGSPPWIPAFAGMTAGGAAAIAPVGRATRARAKAPAPPVRATGLAPRLPAAAASTLRGGGGGGHECGRRAHAPAPAADVAALTPTGSAAESGVRVAGVV